MAKTQPEDERVVAVRAAWEEGFFYVARALNKFLEENAVPQVVEDSGTGEPDVDGCTDAETQDRLKNFRRRGTKQELPEPSSVNRPLREIRQRFLNALVSVRPFVPDLCGDADMTPWSIGYVNSRTNEPTLIYGREDELEPFFQFILERRPIWCWKKDIIAGIVEHQAEWDLWFDGLNDELRKQETPEDNQPDETSRKTIVSVCMQTNCVRIEGEVNEYPVAPHLAHIVNALVQDKIDEDPYSTTDDLQSLPGCTGKNISREIKGLKKQVPPLEDIIDSNHNGYFLKQ